jgi:hypothetical protein
MTSYSLGASRRISPANEGAVTTKAVLRAADRLGIAHRVVATVIGVSEATVSRMGSGTYTLGPGDKSFELALLFVRLFRSLDAIVDGDEAAAAAWLRAENLALGKPPLALIQTVAGLVHVLGYLDTRRALA